MKSYQPIFRPSIPPPPAPAPPEAWIALAIAVVCLSIGVGLMLWVARRNFYRNNAAGIQEFENFRSAVWCGIVEGLAQIVAAACLTVGCVAGLLACVSFLIDGGGRPYSNPCPRFGPRSG